MDVVRVVNDLVRDQHKEVPSLQGWELRFGPDAYEDFMLSLESAFSLKPNGNVALRYGTFPCTPDSRLPRDTIQLRDKDGRVRSGVVLVRRDG